MNVHNSDIKMTDELERRLIQREIDQDERPSGNGSIFALEVVVGTLLLVGMLLLATRFG